MTNSKDFITALLGFEDPVRWLSLCSSSSYFIFQQYILHSLFSLILEFRTNLNK